MKKKRKQRETERDSKKDDLESGVILRPETLILQTWNKTFETSNFTLSATENSNFL